MFKYLIIAYFLLPHIAICSIIINELMPAPNSPEPEWIELYNRGDDNILYDTLNISDPSKTIAISNFYLASKSYCIITSDTIKLKLARIVDSSAKLIQHNLPILNNTNDYLTLSWNSIILDSVYYDMKWGEKGKSFERIDPNLPIINNTNIMVSRDATGATPGKLNSSTNTQQPIGKLNLYINEIMYDCSDANAEYIELFNYSDDSLNLRFCKVYDATRKGIIINKDVILQAHSYLVIFWDTLLFNKFPYLLDSTNVYYSESKLNLNNDGDLIVLMDSRDSLIDSIHYYNNWHNTELDYTKDISLEKVNPLTISNISTNWSSCTNIDGGTPGRQNSYLDSVNIQDNISIKPNPFSVTKSGDVITLEYKVPYISCKLNVKIFDLSGYMVAYPINNQFIGKSSAVTLRPNDLKNNKLSPQPYILLLEATDTDSGQIVIYKALFVVAE
ncbi:MAG TPA: lamin tail domain-containing protein [Candidatus Kapabacteria bacterium]|nr:lamin tail domain-containing protein [Candidatus Kapabacteria bacterium]